MRSSSRDPHSCTHFLFFSEQRHVAEGPHIHTGVKGAVQSEEEEHAKPKLPPDQHHHRRTDCDWRSVLQVERPRELAGLLLQLSAFVAQLCTRLLQVAQLYVDNI